VSRRLDCAQSGNRIHQCRRSILADYSNISWDSIGRICLTKDGNDRTGTHQRLAVFRPCLMDEPQMVVAHLVSLSLPPFSLSRQIV